MFPSPLHLGIHLGRGGHLVFALVTDRPAALDRRVRVRLGVPVLIAGRLSIEVAPRLRLALAGV
jgi:hypothetical protein